MAHLILVRHGQTDWNLERRYQGHMPTSLNAVGRAQADALATLLHSERPDMILSSDLPRARQTAEAIAACHQVEVLSEPRLRELAFGQWEGRTFGEVQACDPEGQARWIEDPLTVAPSGGETLADLAARVRGVLSEMAALQEHQTALLVSHGGTLQVLLCLALGMPPPRHWQLRLDEASRTDLSLYDGGAILTRLNDCHHLAEVSR